MNPTPLPPTAPRPPHGAAGVADRLLWKAIWPLFRVRVQRAFLFVTLMSLGIALLLTVIDRGFGFVNKLIYSACITFSCWLLIDVLRLLASWGVEVLRHQRGLPLSGEPLTIRWTGLLPIILFGVLTGPSLGLSLADAFTGARSPSLWNWGSPATQLTLILTLAGTALSVTVMWLQERMTSARAQAEAARRAQAESQLRLLQSQLEPHMLFNTLANLRVLIGIDAQRAQQMLDHLIAYLRATLQASRREWHPLREEFDRLQDYLELMQIRMGSRLHVRLDLPDSLREQAVPPLLLQPLVENSIHHGLEPKVSGGELWVRARQEGGQLVLSVMDTGMGLQPGAASGGTGFGLEQVRARLDTLYGARASLSLRARTDTTTTATTATATATDVDSQGTEATVRLPIDTRNPPSP